MDIIKPLTSSLLPIVKRIKNEVFLFLMAIVILIVIVTVALGSSRIVTTISLLTLAAITFFYILKLWDSQTVAKNRRQHSETSYFVTLAVIVAILIIVAIAVLVINPLPTSTLPTPTTPSIVGQVTTTVPTPTSKPDRNYDRMVQQATNFKGSNHDWKPLFYVFQNDATETEMVIVPVGSFEMESNGGGGTEQPNRQTFSKPFWIDRFEVTNKQFETFNNIAWAGNSYFCDPDQNQTITPSEHDNCAQLPRETINWLGASDYCERRGARLPTEAEWEFAARGPDSWIYPWGNEFVRENVVYSGSSQGPAEVGDEHWSGGQSWVGAYDMSGNVWEWVNTIYDPVRFPFPYKAYDGREKFSNSSEVQRVLRGGSFANNKDELSATIRIGSNIIFQSRNIGLRCARNA